jgi:hypothetical protein
VFSLPAVYCYACVDDTDGSICMSVLLFQLGTFRICKDVCVYSGTDYSFAVLFR